VREARVHKAGDAGGAEDLVHGHADREGHAQTADLGGIDGAEEAGFVERVDGGLVGLGNFHFLGVGIVGAAFLVAFLAGRIDLLHRDPLGEVQELLVGVTVEIGVVRVVLAEFFKLKHLEQHKPNVPRIN